MTQLSCAGIVSKFERPSLVEPSSKCAKRRTYTPSSTLRSPWKHKADEEAFLKQSPDQQLRTRKHVHLSQAGSTGLHDFTN